MFSAISGVLGNIFGTKKAINNLVDKDNGLLVDPSCVRLVNGFLGGYCYKEVGSTGIYSESPLKNRFSHPHDALQYVMTKLVLTDHLSMFDPTDLNKCAA